MLDRWLLICCHTILTRTEFKRRREQQWMLHSCSNWTTCWVEGEAAAAAAAGRLIFIQNEIHEFILHCVVFITHSNTCILLTRRIVWWYNQFYRLTNSWCGPPESFFKISSDTNSLHFNKLKLEVNNDLEQQALKFYTGTKNEDEEVDFLDNVGIEG